MAITFDQGNHPDRVPHPSHFPLMVSLTVGKLCLTKVLMDGRSMLYIIYVDILNKMTIPRSSLYPSGASFFGIVLSKEALPLGRIWLHVTFSKLDKFYKESLTFEVVGFLGT
jgi:hypothetical protein